MTKPDTQESFAADSLATGIVVVLGMTIIQRAVGFFRGIWICRMLNDTEVGQWAMAIGFILLITPVMLFGIPGSLPRYTEHFRMRGHLPAFVRRLAWTTLICAVTFFGLVLLVPQWLAWFIFLEPQNASLVHSVGVAVLAIAAFYFVNDLISSLRQVRVVSLMQFIQSLMFTGLAVAALQLGYGLIGVILSFAIATVVALLPGLWVLRRGWSGLPRSDEPFEAPKMWRRLLPYAAAIWGMNLLGNVFELSDRYMILHFTSGGEAFGQAAVGQYHSGRMLPVLLLSLAALITGVLMPYLSADWENGREREVRERMRRVLLGISALFTIGGAVAMLFAPWMFSTLLEGRYSDGLALMPMAFVFCTWAGLVVIAESYLFVIERGKLVAAAAGAGLVANIALNAILLPMWGLHGAVVATLCSHGVVMTCVLIAMARNGFGFDRSIFYVTLMPATLLGGPAVAMISVIVCLAASEQARAWINEAIEQVMQKRQLSRAA